MQGSPVSSLPTERLSSAPAVVAECSVTTRLSLAACTAARPGRGVGEAKLSRASAVALAALDDHGQVQAVVAALLATLQRYLDQDQVQVALAPVQGSDELELVGVELSAESRVEELWSAVSAALATSSSGAGVTNVACWVSPTRARARGTRGFEVGFEVGFELADEPRVIVEAEGIDADALERFAAHCGRVLGEILERPDRRLGELELLTPDEIAEQVGWLERTTRVVPHMTIHAAFAAQVERAPDRIAARCASESLTYAELHTRAMNIAEALVASGLELGEVVAIELDRSCELLAVVLGVLAAGGVFFMVDPQLPRGRVARLIRESGARVVIDEDRAQELARGPGHRTSLPEVDPSANAYLIFTSGSAGRPKAVVVSHAAFVNRMQWLARAYDLGPTDVSLQKSPLSFDPAICEMLRLLPVGGCSSFLPAGLEKDQAELVDAIASYKVTIIDLVPSPLTALLDHLRADPAQVERVASLRWVLAGAETMTTALVERFHAIVHASTGAELINTWGATETCVDVTHFNCSREAHNGRVPVGRAIDNARICLLDRGGRLLPVGCVGEIHVAGVCLASGYANLPELSAERFMVQDGVLSGRCYRSGDRGRWRDDGVLEYLGRDDDQLKVRGVRIAPGEIEVALASHPAIARALVRAHQSVRDPSGLLLAYVTPVEPNGAMTQAELLAYLGQQLPAHSIPDRVFVLDRFPITANEKIDVGALPLPGRYEGREPHGRRPATPSERALAEIWMELLDLDDVGVDEDFFDLGGHSLAAARVVARIVERFGVRLSLRTVLRERTIATLAAELERTQAPANSRPPLAALPATGSRAQELASHAQSRIWLLSQFDEASEAYNIPLTLALDGRLESDRLQAALDYLVARHEVLRTRYRWNQAGLIQIIDPPRRALVEVSLRRSGAGRAEAEAVARSVHAARFDLERGPVLRVTLIEDGRGHSLFALTMHHIVADAWSQTTMLEELFDAYARELDYDDALGSTAPSQYADYCRWERERLAGPDGEALAGYWRSRLAGDLPVLRLPCDAPRPARPSYRGRNFGFQLDAGLGRALSQLGRERAASPFMALLAAFTVLLHRFTRQEEFVIGTPVAGRSRSEFERSLGCFVNSLPLRIEADGGRSFMDVLDHVRERCIEAFEHQSYPFDRIVADLGGARDVRRSPLFDLMLVLQDAPSPDLGRAFAGLSTDELELDMSLGKLDMIVTFVPDEDGFAGCVQYNTDLFEESTVAAMVDGFLALTRACIDGPELAIAAHPMVDASPSPAAAVSSSARPFMPLHQFVAAQAERTPHAEALCCGSRSYTYEQLVSRASTIAQVLRTEHGIGRGDVVALFLPRSEWTVIAELAVLATGATFLPIDRGYPERRIRFILADAEPKLVLTDGASLDHAALFDGLETVAVDGLALASGSAVLAGPTLAPTDAAYLIYTSGSSGEPKGVLVEHGNICALLQVEGWIFDFRADDVWTLFHSAGFDFSVWEIYVPLSRGARLVVLEDELIRDVDRLAAHLIDAGVTVLCQVPSAFEVLAERLQSLPRQRPLALRYVIFGGEPVRNKHLDALRQLEPQLRFINGYGITETTIFSSFHEIGPSEAQDWQNIGRPLANQQMRLLDAELRPVPRGVPGEIVIGGPSVARGYLNRAQLQAARFVDDPWSGPGARMYRSGDYARMTASGDLIFLGREDSQVKVRGFRIEFEEIRRALLELPSIRDCFVTSELDPSGQARIVAYLATSGPLDLDELREQLSTAIPRYMVPSRMVVLERLPLSANGKVDRQALREADSVSTEVEARETHTTIETWLVELWTELLGYSQFGLDDDFFSAGGHSLSAVQLINAIEAEHGDCIGIGDVFEPLSLRAMAARIAAKSEAAGAARALAAAAAPSPGEPRASVELSASQLEFWLLDHFREPGRSVQAPEVDVLEFTVEPEHARAALAELCRRFDILRSRVSVEGGQPYLTVDPEWSVDRSLRFSDVSGAEDPHQAARELWDRECVSPIDLSVGPLLRVHLVRLGLAQSLALWTVHHIASDGWSLELMWRTWRELVERARRGDALSGPRPTLQFADFTRWHRAHLDSEIGRAEIDGWIEELADFEAPTLFGTRAEPRYYGATRELVLSPRASEGLRALCRRTGATSFMGLLSVVKLFLRLATGVADLVVGCPTANRVRTEFEDQIGPFLNVLPLRDQIRLDDTAATIVERVRATTTRALARPLVPIAVLVERLPALATRPLFEVGFTLQSQARETRSRARPSWLPEPETFFGIGTPLWIDAIEIDAELALRVSWAEDCFSPAESSQLCTLMSAVFEVALVSPDKPISELADELLIAERGASPDIELDI